MAQRKVVGYVSRLNTYPVKSGGSVALETSEVTQLGLKHDRQFVLVNEFHTVLKLSKFTKLVKLKQTITESDITLKYSGMKDLQLPLSMDGADDREKRDVTVKGLTASCVHVSHEADAWFSELLDMKGVQLFCFPTGGTPRHAPDFGANIKDYRNDKDTVMFANHCPILLVNESSVERLKEMIDEDVTVGNFRPTVVVSGCQPFAEEGWGLIAINNVQLQALFPAIKCPDVNIDPVSGDINKEILRGLRKERPAKKLGYIHPNMKGHCLFGMYLGVRREGTINVGDTVYHVSS